MGEILQTKEVVKLYEYSYNTMDLDDVLEHHGIKGQRHGVRNGPPYPLDSRISTGKRLKKSIGSVKRKKKKKEQPVKVYSDKREAINAKDLEYISRNKGMFSTNELNEVMNRVNAETRIDKMVYDQKKAKKITSNKIFRNVAATAISGFTYGAINFALSARSGKDYDGKDFARDFAIASTVTGLGRLLPVEAKGDIYRLKVPQDNKKNK